MEVVARTSEITGKKSEGATASRVHLCTICKKVYTRKSYLNQHQLKHSGKRPFKCQVCNSAFFEKSNLTRHEIIHSGNKPFKCDLCNVAFTRNGCLTKHHGAVHRREYKYKFECVFCGKPQPQKSALGTHLLSHIKEKPFFCTKCPFESSSISDLKRHTEIHNMQRKRTLICGICQRGFFTNRQLMQHIVCHTGEKYFKCNVCNKPFRTGYGLNAHKVVHTGEKPFACSTCPKRFSEKGNLRRHLATHNRRNTILL